ncbi:MAG: apolipoprotein N-acyltransferase, partial [Candidatus Omnitrophota bacterium]
YRLFKNSFKEMIIAIILVATVLIYGRVKISEDIKKDSIKISVIQSNISQEMKWKFSAREDILEKQSTLTSLASLDEPDLIVWPETSFPGFFKEDMQLTNKVLELAKDVQVPLLVGTNTLKYNYYFNSAVLISKDGEMVDKYDKVHLVPFGEYVPGSDRFPALRDLIMGAFGEFTPGKDFKIFSLPIGSQTQIISGYGRQVTEDVKFAALICFEDVFPKLAKEFVRRGAQFIVVITNDAWYGNSPAAYQHAACSVFRAIENRVSIVRCANTGYSCFIDTHGRIYSDVNEKGKHLFITGHKTSFVKY